MSQPLSMTLPCPLCQKEHTYPVVVERSMTAGMQSGRTPAPEVRRQFVRLFLCPTTFNRFEATLRLKETAANRITAVTARAPVEQGDE
jgi:hypothetical protein